MEHLASVLFSVYLQQNQGFDLVYVGELPVLVHVVLSACAGSPTTQDRTATREITRLPYCLPPTHHGVGILIPDFSKLNSPAHWYLCLRFTRHLTMSHARLEARMDSLFPFL